jgi:PAS domain S-box-containing protein
MVTEINFSDYTKTPYLYAHNRAVVRIGQAFTDLTGYELSEVFRKDIPEVFKLLRVNCDFTDLAEAGMNTDLYLFTKSFEPIEFTVSISRLPEIGDEIYILNEKPDTRLSDKIHFVEALLSDNTLGCSIYSVPDLILLKANFRHLDFMDPPYNDFNKCIGASLYESVPNFKGSNTDELYSAVLKTSKPGFYNELKYMHHKKGTTYWNGSVYPIYVNGKMKYIFQTAVEITEQIVNRDLLVQHTQLMKYHNIELEAIIEGMTDNLFIFDKDCNYTRLSKAAREYSERLYGGLSRLGDGLKNTELYDENDCIIPLEDIPVHRILRGERLIGHRVKLKSEDSIIYNDINGTPIYDADNNFIAGVLFSRDVTEKVLHEKKIKEQTEQLVRQNEVLNRQLSFLNLSNDAIITLDINRKITFWNKGAEKLYGFTSNEAVGCFITDLLNSVFIGITDIIESASVCNKQWSSEIEHTTKDGRKVIVDSRQQLFTENNGQEIVLKIDRDITERKKAAKALTESEEKYRSLFDRMNEGFFMADIITDETGEPVDYRYLAANSALDHFIGIQHETIIGKRRSEVFQKPGQWLETYGKVALTGQSISFEDYSAEFERYFMFTAYSPRRGQFACLVRDVTEQKKMEKALIDNEEKARKLTDELRQADTRKNEFLGMLSHELRNPLAIIMMSLSLLRRVGLGEDQASKSIAIIERQAGQLSHLIDDLLDITRITRNKIELRKERVELNSLIDTVVKDFSPQFKVKDIKLVIEKYPAALSLEADYTRLTQVVGNLLHNALKFTAKGGRTTVSIKKDEDNQQAVICVEDDGLGIPPELLPRMFEPFMQANNSLDRSEGGLGLGLAIVKGMVELHGGTVEAFSGGLEKGTQFIVHLPLPGNNGSYDKGTPNDTVKHSDCRRILLIDDNQNLAETMRLLLEFFGHEVITAFGGLNGLKKAEEIHPQVIMCDIGMPDIDGYEVARRIRRNGELEGTYLIAFSGYAQPEDISRSADAGFDMHIIKPVDIDELQLILTSIQV